MVVVLVGFAARRPALANDPALPAPEGPVAWSSLWVVSALVLVCDGSVGLVQGVGLLELVGPGSPGPRDGRGMFSEVHAEPD